ncbi:DUF448 domain-containing protein [Desulfotalea psychrophila]|uniref:DUF448 domain-containing protein n=1 Tax=Desulfotalea psychrophila TaxID=84980 RepID=UPI000322529C|nr:DUF448 domain-containing protein [Desulfotalea psychrophila]
MVVRTCVSCGVKQEKQTLRRFVWRGEAPFFDEKAVLEGRGAYCCDKDNCSEQLMKQQRRWKRIFRL